jgi:hypothetical protein
MPTAPRRSRRTLIAFVATALTVSACGGSDDENGSDSAGDDSAAVSADVDASADVAATDGSADTASTGESSDETTPPDSASGDGDFCDQIRELAADESDDGDIASAVDDLEALAEDAPDDVRADLDTIIGAFSELEDLDETDPDSFLQFLEVFERPEVIEASEDLERYGVEECGLPPSTDAVPAGEDGEDLEDVGGSGS